MKTQGSRTGERCMARGGRSCRGRITLLFVAALLLFLTLTGTALAADRWSDISDQEWIDVYQTTAAKIGTVADGYLDHTFKPSKLITREQFAKMAVDGLGLTPLTPPSARFSDVPATHPYYKWIEGAAAKNTIGGFTDNTFRSSQHITRQQGDSILSLYLSQKEMEITGYIQGANGQYASLAAWYLAEGAALLAPFADDQDVAAVHRQATAYLIHQGAVKGSQVGAAKYLRPLSYLTRAQAAVMIVRVKETEFEPPVENTAPVLDTIGDKTVDEMTLLTFTPTATDNDGDTLTYSLADPTSGTFPTGATINGTTGLFDWTPTEAQGPGTYRVIVRVSDGSASDQEEILITVREVNAAPVLYAIGNKTANELSLLSFTVIATDSEGGTLTYSLANPSTGTFPAGAVIDPATGVFTWTPTEVQGPGTYRVIIRVSDGVNTDREEIRIRVKDIDNAPVLDPIGNKTVNELVELIFTATATDTDSVGLAYSLLNAPAGASIDPNTGVFTWTPTEAQGPGVYNVTFRVSDGSLTAEEVVAITVNEVNTAPVAVADSYSTDEDTPLSIVPPGVLGNDADVDGDTLTVTGYTSPDNGTLYMGPRGNFTYTPTANFNGTCSFNYEASDGAGGTTMGTVSITVTAVNDPPTAVADSYSTNEDTPLSIVPPGVLGNDADVDGDTLTVTGYTSPDNGTLYMGPRGNFTYTPTANFNGTCSFNYEASDGAGGTTMGTVSITVTAVNDPPT